MALDLKKLVDGVLDAGEKLLPALEGTPAAAVVAAGRSVLGLIDTVREVASNDDEAQLNAIRDRLEPAVLAHLDRTIDSLD